MLVHDALGRRVALRGVPRRIVSLVPSLTEYLCAIGAGDRLVGITDYCTEPAAALAGLPRMRGTKNPDRAAITVLRPDLVLAAKEENRERDVLALEAAGVPVYVSDIRSVAGAATELAALAALLDAEAGAAPLLADLHNALAATTRTTPAVRPRALVFIWRDPWMAAGADTYASDLLACCGIENLAARLPGRYPRADLTTWMALDPEIVFLPDEPYPFSPGDLPAFTPFDGTPAVRTNRLVLCDGKLFTWYGPRTAAALRWLQTVAGDDIREA